ncbi:MAG: extracellular solute-binding protein [Clostridiales bacterium]|nr:extracellular solute-binding protein [Clostridiales bacterium]
MRTFKRIVSFTLSAVLLTSVCLSAASCKKKASAGKKIAETDTWYDAKRIELDPGFTSDKYESVYPNGPWKCGDKYLMQYFTMNKLDYSKDLSTQDSTSNLMGIFDQDGKLLRLVDLLEITSMYQSSFDMNVFSFSEGGNGIRVYFNTIAKMDAYWCDIDPDTGLLVGEVHPFDFSELRLDEDDGKNKGTWESGDLDLPEGSYEKITYYVSYIQVIEGYEVVEIGYGTGGQEMLAVAKDGKALYRVDFDTALGLGELKFVKEFYGGGNGTVLIEGIGKTAVSVSLDLATGKLTKLSSTQKISDNQRLSISSEGKGYLTKATGVYEFDAATGKEICSLDFDNCNVNRYESQKASVLSFEENKVTLGYFEPVDNAFLLSATSVIYTLEKAEKNPNAGKTVLTVASLSDSLSYFEGAALKAFNDQNQDYFAKLILYDQSEFLAGNEETTNIDETDRRMYSAKSMVSGSLASDIRSGMGPDVVLGAAQSIDVLDAKYLLDLEDYLKGKTFDANSYYMNLIDASKMDGKTYFIPTSFTLTGIVTDGSALASDQKGFTYDQYADFVSGQCIGEDPVTTEVSRMHFLNLCIERNYASWIKEGRVSFDQEGFREMTEFFKDSIPEGVSETAGADETMMEMYGMAPAPKEAYFLEDIHSVAGLAHVNCYGDNLRILGLPSADGSGPSANITTSFSITKSTEVKEGAYVLLDFMLSENVQKDVKAAIPVNRAAVSYKVEKEKETNSTAYHSYFDTPDALISEEIFREGSIFEPDSVLPDTFLQTLEGVDTILLSDNAVMMIVSEEIPAYLLGQKDLETVISTINNRTQTVFNER